MSVNEPSVYVYRFLHPEKNGMVSQYYVYAVSKELAIRQYKKLLKMYYELDSIPVADSVERANDYDKPFVRMEIGDDDR